MITLDASILAAFFDADDGHHEHATALLSEHADELLYLNPITEAETLVRAARAGREEDMYRDIRQLGIQVLPPSSDAGVWLAQLRARTGAKLPDCCVILTAQQSDSRIATFDAGLARTAGELGIEVLTVAEPA